MTKILVVNLFSGSCEQCKHLDKPLIQEIFHLSLHVKFVYRSFVASETTCSFTYQPSPSVASHEQVEGCGSNFARP